ncbi:MAG: MraY family glycosyltransferase [Bacteroidia bacterium]
MNVLFARLFRHAATTPKYDPKNIRWSSCRVPVVGGVSFLVAFLLAGVVMAYEGMILPPGLLVGGVIAYGVGILDDTYVTTPVMKFLGQLAAALVVLFLTGGMSVTGVELMDAAFTLFWYVAVMNAFNMMDNMDAVSGGIALGILGGLGFLLVATEIFPIIFALVGVLIGFLVVNWPPARLYMGDNGSQFIGFCLAYCMHASWRSLVYEGGVGYALGVMLGLFALLASDTFWVIVSRVMRKKSPFSGNTDHLSHNLVRMGIASRRIPILLGLMQIFLSGVVVYGQNLIWSWASAALVFVLVGATHMATLYPTLRRAHATP